LGLASGHRKVTPVLNTPKLTTIVMAAAMLSAASYAWAAQPLNHFDGYYSGQPELVSTDSASCPRTGPTGITIRMGTVTLPWYPESHFSMRIDGNGSFNGIIGMTQEQAEKRLAAPPSATGHIVNNHLVVDYGTRSCHYTLDAVRT
jgi:hypothetical protein